MPIDGAGVVLVVLLVVVVVGVGVGVVVLVVLVVALDTGKVTLSSKAAKSFAMDESLLPRYKPY